MGQEPTGSVQQNMDATCDLIMKGGITSGIVYPSAVLALREKGYRFKSIGGASAGAIAAAATAGAQFGEIQGAGGPPNRKGSQGFAALSALQEELSTPGLIKQLFRPSKKAAPAFEFLLRLQETKGSFRKVVVGILALLTRLWVPTLAWVVGTLVALAFMVSRFGGGDTRTAGAWVVLGVILVAVATLALGGSAIFRAWRVFTVHLPNNNFGICNGMSRAEGEQPALTEWLYTKIQDCAGLSPDRPLTFEDLGEKGIELSMMTTDLTHAAPLRLPLSTNRSPVPLSTTESPVPLYLFAVEDFRALFPEPVVEKMIDDSEHFGTANAENKKVDLRKLPTSKLPVIVATRMSLSFPILLSAVPLWSEQDGTVAKHWISDGGITSNFPIHFFDAWLPTRPTFGLSLVPARRAQGAGTRGIGAEQEPIQEDPYTRRPRRHRAEINSTVGFLGQILDTMQNWRDLLQSELPGFRDRIRSIELEEDEGGMNLSMPPSTIETLTGKGREAAETLAATFKWDLHRTERYRTLMHLLNREINGSGSGMKQAYEDHFKELLNSNGKPQTATDQWGPDADELTVPFLESAAKWDKHFVREPAPDPDPTLRVTPKE